MSTLILFAKLSIAILVLLRCICLGSTVSRREWVGHPLRFVLLAGSYSLLAGGSIAWLFGMGFAVWMFAFGAAAMLLHDRRQS